MKKLVVVLAVVMLSVLVFATVQASPSQDACWGQASAVYAQMGEMGEHSRSFETPRVGLRNLARALYALPDSGLADDSMASLGAYVAAELGLSIEACQ